MIENTNTVKLIPYLGRSKNLMEDFFIIGYDEKILSKLPPNNLENEKIELSLIANEISNTAFSRFNLNDLMKQIYPDIPNIIKIKKSEKPNDPTSVIFSYCFYFEGTQIFYSCYALKFYEKYIISEYEYYVPKAFIIISEYPYFTTFYKICWNLYKINIEKDDDKKIYKSLISKHEVNNKIKIPIEIFIYYLINYIPSPLNDNISLNIFDNDSKIFIPKLTGYPYLDFDLCKLLNIMKIKNFIKIFILVFLETDLLFFSYFLQKLNLFMYALYKLNFPLTNSDYFSNIKTYSKNKISKIDTLFTFIGINTNYNHDLDLSYFKNLNYIVDIDYKKPLIKITNNNNDIKEKEDLNKLLEYIKKSIKKKEDKSKFLSNHLRILIAKLTNIIENYNEYIKNEKNVTNSFFYIDKEIIQKNKEIQEVLYNFVLIIIGELYNYYRLDNSENFCPKIIEDKNYTDPEYSEEEKFFLKKCRDCMKYKLYFENFVQNFDAPDEFKISYLFSDEFTYLIKKDRNIDKYYKLDYLNKCYNCIDKLYNIENENVKINYKDIFDNLISKQNEKSIIQLII